MSPTRFSRIAAASIVAGVVGSISGMTMAAKVTECSKVAICYCINDEHNPAIATKTADGERRLYHSSVVFR